MMKIFPETIKKYMSRIAWASVFALLILFGAASVFSQPLGGVVPAEKEAAPASSRVREFGASSGEFRGQYI
jgi:hypothetical protein